MYKSITQRLSIIGLVFFTLIGCKKEPTIITNSNYQYVEGETMGTAYHIQFNTTNKAVNKASIDSLLRQLNKEVSTYDTSAIIAKFNASKKAFHVNIDTAQHFYQNLQIANDIRKATRGDFNHEIMPLVNIWGFGYKTKAKDIDSSLIQSTLAYIKNPITIGKNGTTVTLLKKDARQSFDFSALAKGYGVDLVALYFDKHNVTDYLVEIGGEARTRGRNKKGNVWTLGINKPKENSAVSDIHAAVPLLNGAMATSGNYRNFYEENGEKFVHTINPKTGFTRKSSLVSSTVIFTEGKYLCTKADAYATALMVMGLPKAYEFAQTNKLNTLLIEILPNGEFKEYKTGLLNQ